MPTLVELPDSQTALLKDSDQLSNRDVKTLRRAARKVGIIGNHLKDLGLDDLRDDTPEEEQTEEAKAENNKKALEILTQLSDAEDDDLDFFQRVSVIVRLIDWSLDIPQPTTPEEVDDLPRPVYVALTTAATKLDLNENFGNDPESKVAAMSDPKAPTTDLEDSEQSSMEDSP